MMKMMKMIMNETHGQTFPNDLHAVYALMMMTNENFNKYGFGYRNVHHFMKTNFEEILWMTKRSKMKMMMVMTNEKFS